MLAGKLLDHPLKSRSHLVERHVLESLKRGRDVLHSTGGVVRVVGDSSDQAKVVGREVQEVLVDDPEFGRQVFGDDLSGRHELAVHVVAVQRRVLVRVEQIVDFLLPGLEQLARLLAVAALFRRPLLGAHRGEVRIGVVLHLMAPHALDDTREVVRQVHDEQGHERAQSFELAALLDRDLVQGQGTREPVGVTQDVGLFEQGIGVVEDELGAASDLGE